MQLLVLILSYNIPSKCDTEYDFDVIRRLSRSLSQA